MKESFSEDAVSPVIGTILLVAITVVLISIIAAVIMGMSGGLQGHKEVGLTVQPNIYDYDLGKGPEERQGVTVVFQGGRDLAEIRNVTVWIANYHTYNISNTKKETNPPTLYYRLNDIEIGKPYVFRLDGNALDEIKAKTGLSSVPIIVKGEFPNIGEVVIYSGTHSFVYDNIQHK